MDSQGCHLQEHCTCIIHLKTKESATLINKELITATCFHVPGSDFKDPSLREEIPFVVKVSLHSDDLFLLRLGSEDILLLRSRKTNQVYNMLR